MRPFNLEKALAGEPVTTRDGQEATQPHLFSAENTLYPLVFVVGGKLHAFAPSGRHFPSPDGPPSPYDLFMAPKKRLVHFNFYEIGRGGLYPINTFGSDMRGYGYLMPEDAEKWGVRGERIGGRSYPVEIDEE